jgi:hypothetical protein
MNTASQVCTFIVLATVGLASTARADVVTEWNVAALNAIRVERTAPPIASRALAILHASIYDAVIGITRTHQPYHVRSAVPAAASAPAAANAAARVALSALFPARAAIFDSAYEALSRDIPDGPQKQMGITWGESVARQLLAAREHDGAAVSAAPPAGSGPGAWVPTLPAFATYALPGWAFVTPFALSERAQMRPVGPPAINSVEYTAEFNEVKSMGAATNSARTADQSVIAEFWADGAGTETPPGHWNTIARNVAAARHNSVEQNARLFALLNLAMADAAICAWDAKYNFNFWRPITAIHVADDDGNPDTVGDPAWRSFIATPPFPDYVSGHSTFSGAAARVLARFYGTDDVAFVTGSDFLPGVLRAFSRFSDAAREAALSRLYGGIHFRSANEHGMTAGIAIGDWVFEHTLVAKSNRSRD